MLNRIDDLLNRITMYRLILYYLTALFAAALIFGLLGVLPYNPAELALSAVIVVGTCVVANRIFAVSFDAITNIESVYITALILVLIIPPSSSTNSAGIGFLLFASVWAMASKYMLAVNKKHIFNPAAFAVALSALAISEPATWWVGGNLALLPFVLIGGLLVVRKVQRFDMVLCFAAAALITITAASPSGEYIPQITQTFLHSSFLFFAFVMLTEPLTTPPTRPLRIIYGALVGFLFAPSAHIGSFYLTPELALIAGNIFSYIVSPKGRYMMTLAGVENSAKNVYDFLFVPDKKLSFLPGQYMEWTLGHKHPDDRGNRRYLTIASSPAEDTVRIGVKFYTESSTFKRTLAEMKIGDKISASHLSGGFVLPRNQKEKIVFIAGGIGITPFRSMIQYLLDKKERRTITLVYSNATPEDAAYKDIFSRAENELGIKTVYAYTQPGVPVPGAYNGFVDAKLIMREVPDFRERAFYISGPRTMVESFKKTLRETGIPRSKIKSDFFPGFA